MYTRYKRVFALNWKHLISLFLLLCVSAVASASETVSLSFRINQSSVDASFRNNSTSLGAIEELLLRENLSTVTVKASCSPDGPLAFNRYLARMRGESVANYISSIKPELQVKVEVIEEDWAGLTSYVKRSSKPWKEEALEILRTGGENRKQLLQELWVGEAWEDMVKNYFSRLRKATVAFEFTPEPEEVMDIASIVFPRGVGSSIWPGFENNRAALQKLQILAHSGADTLYIKGYCSPDGSAAANEKLANKRANLLKKYLEDAGFKGKLQVVPYGVRDRSAEVSLNPL